MANAEDTWSVGEAKIQGKPVVYKFINNLPNINIRNTMPWLTVVSWKYDGSENSGMPSKVTNEAMIKLEDGLETIEGKGKTYHEVYSATGNNLKEFVFYIADREQYMGNFNKALNGHPAYPIEINFYEDKAWSDLIKIQNEFGVGRKKMVFTGKPDEKFSSREAHGRQAKMTTADDLYSEVKPDIEAVANPLFDFSVQCLQKRGNFLPHAAVLDTAGKVALVAAAPGHENDKANSIEVLPLLHDGLRAEAKEKDLVAIGVAENVTVTPDGQPSTQAIKVLFEHKRGLVVALYLPFKKQFLRGYSFGQTFTVLAPGEVNAWAETVA